MRRMRRPRALSLLGKGVAITTLSLFASFGGALLMAPGVASASSGVPSSCTYGATCLYPWTYFGNPIQGSIYGTNWFWNWPANSTYCHSGSWNDCADSLANDEGSLNYFYQNLSCTTGGGAVTWLYPVTKDETVPNGLASQITSNSYGYYGAC
jgi:hypothetical protein